MPSCSVDAPYGLPIAPDNCTFAPAWMASRPPTSSRNGIANASMNQPRTMTPVPWAGNPRILGSQGAGG